MRYEGDASGVYESVWTLPGSMPPTANVDVRVLGTGSPEPVR